MRQVNFRGTVLELTGKVEGVEEEAGIQSLPKRKLREAKAFAKRLADREWIEALQMARVVACACLPRRPCKEKTVERTLKLGREVWVRVIYEAEDGVELPYGEDRCVLAAILHQALTRDTPVVRLETANELLKLLGMSGGGKDYMRLRERLKRLGGLKIRLAYAKTEEGLEDSGMVDRTLVFRRQSLPTVAEIRAAEEGQMNLPVLSPGYDEYRYVVLSGDLWDEVQQARQRFLVPLELLRQFKDMPAAWDLLVILVARCSVAQSKSMIPHDSLLAMFRDGKEPARKVAARLKQYLELIHVATDNRLDAQLVAYAEKRKPGQRGRPKKLWGLVVGPSAGLFPRTGSRIEEGESGVLRLKASQPS